MKLFKTENKSTNPRQKKLSLIKLLYIYPIVFFLIGLSTITAYYTWLQIYKYKHQVEKLKKEFPEKQRTELKSRILLLKDYIYWVKSHPDEYTAQFLNNRIKSTETILSSSAREKFVNITSIPKELTYSLDDLNKRSIAKIIILNDKQEILYPELPSKYEEGYNSSRMLNYLYKVESYIYADSLINITHRNKISARPYLLVKKSNLKGINIGIVFQADQKTELIQEMVLDSLSKIKYANKEYVIINTYDGSALLAKGRIQIPPIIIKNSTETNWKDVFKKELEFAKQSKGGYITYLWRNRPNIDQSEKISYFSGINDWEWIIGTGFFTNDINPLIKQMNDELWNDIIKNLILFFIFLVILNVLAYLTIRFYARKAKSNILLFLHFFKQAADGMQIIDSSQIAFSEFDTLAMAANRMIQEKERIRSVLSAEKSRLRYMIDAIPDLIFFKDVDSKFLGCNKAFENYINKKSEDIIGLSEFELFEKNEASEYVQSDKKIFETLEPERITNWVEYSNGRRLLFYTLKTPYFDSDDNVLGIIAISRDITEIEETRQRLILAKEKAEESDRLKTAFLANMSHEIRTPMNAIIGFSDLLSEDDLTQDDKDDFISKIKNAGHSLMTLINDIIDIAKIEAGQLKISESACNINQMLTELRDTFHELKNLSGKENISLNLVLPDDKSNPLIITDPMRLQQIFTNLLSNALKFTEFGSIEFGYTINDDIISFYVNDSGIGILRSKQKLLFQRFSQLDPSTTRKYGGTGLGLAISKNLIELLGGSIGLESSPGKGSSFHFTIPYKLFKSLPSVKTDKIDVQDINWEGKTILIAEDVIQNFMLIEAILKHSGVRLIHATNGQIAIDIVRSEPDIDLIMMDIQLPVKTGYEALKEILEIRPEIPIMSYTAFALPHEREKSIAAGFVDFIPKPIKPEILIPMLNRYLQNQG